jgi:hypothetical protein
MTTPDQVQTAALAMMADLCKTKDYAHGCLLEFVPTSPDNVVVRGHIDLTSLARAALDAIARMENR